MTNAPGSKILEFDLEHVKSVNVYVGVNVKSRCECRCENVIGVKVHDRGVKIHVKGVNF